MAALGFLKKEFQPPVDAQLLIVAVRGSRVPNASHLRPDSTGSARYLSPNAKYWGNSVMAITVVYEPNKEMLRELVATLDARALVKLADGSPRPTPEIIIVGDIHHRNGVPRFQAEPQE